MRRANVENGGIKIAFPEIEMFLSDRIILRRTKMSNALEYIFIYGMTKYTKRRTLSWQTKKL